MMRLFNIFLFFGVIFVNVAFGKNIIVMPKQNDVSNEVYSVLKNDAYKDVLQMRGCHGSLEDTYSIIAKQKDFIVIRKNTTIECKTMVSPSVDVKNFILDNKTGAEIDFKSKFNLLSDGKILKTGAWKFLKNELLNKDPNIDSQCFDMISEKENLSTKEFVIYPNGAEIVFLFSMDKMSSMCFDDISVKTIGLQKK
jgi:hypothetical protein